MPAPTLNAEQKRAASHGGGPALTLAGPGTGKTTALVGRFEELVRRGVPANWILVATFTAKAAEEMRERIGAALGAFGGREERRALWIGTFHSLCGRLLKSNAAACGVDPGYEIYDEIRQRGVLDRIGADWDSDDGDLVEVIGRWKDSMTSPERALAEAGADPTLARAAEHYAAYEAEMRRLNALDFADLILKVVEGMRADLPFRAWVHQRFTHLLVDEFQDVNKLQVTFLQLALNRERNLWAVGDDDQAIYGWRGAEIGYSVDFARHFEGARTYLLTANYRSSPLVVGGANAVIANNRRRIPKALVAHRAPDPVRDAVIVRGFAHERLEAEWIAGQIKDLLARRAVATLAEVAVLFRSASAAPSLQKALDAAGVPFALAGASNFWTLPEVRAVTATLRLIADPGDREAERHLGGGKRSEKLRALVESMKGATVKEAARAVGREVRDLAPRHMDAERRTQWMDAAEQAAEEALRFGEFAPFIAHADAKAREKGRRAKEAAALSSVHSSKGLEWAVVFVAGCEEGMMPHAKAKEFEEERRLFYVAATRTKGILFLTHSRHRFGREQAPSRFLEELAKGAAAERGTLSWRDRNSVRGEAPDFAGPSHFSRRTAGRPASASPAPVSAGSAKDVGGVRVFRHGSRRSLIAPEEREG